MTPVDRNVIPRTFGRIVSQESIEAVQEWPTPEQQTRINAYRLAYRTALGFPPHGLHYIPELGGVWLPPEETGEGHVQPEVERIPPPH